MSPGSDCSWEEAQAGGEDPHGTNCKKIEGSRISNKFWKTFIFSLLDASVDVI